MSLGIVIKAPEGIVLAAESRVTLTAQAPGQPPLHVNFDNATKVLSFSEPDIFVGGVTYGLGAIGLRTAQSFLPEFESGRSRRRLLVRSFAQRLSAFYMQQWGQEMPSAYQGPSMTFVVAGYDPDEPYGSVYQFEIPTEPRPTEQNRGNFGIIWGGQREYVDRIINGFDHRVPQAAGQHLGLDGSAVNGLENHLGQFRMHLPLLAMPLQDCVDLAIFFVRTTIEAQRLSVGIRGCGGHIDVATITRREGLKFVQRKAIRGEHRL
ncbi:hypothetical protein JXA47_16285 [Candidatus Sumerlaeota bacterium]|nr:hypothetical protein [Candidatus Sumerlaeota bacterium]